MLKVALFDRAINGKLGYSVDWGRGICPLFSCPPWGILQLKFSSPGNLQSKAQKNTNARGLAGGGGGGGGDWAQLDLTDA